MIPLVKGLKEVTDNSIIATSGDQFNQNPEITNPWIINQNLHYIGVTWLMINLSLIKQNSAQLCNVSGLRTVPPFVTAHTFCASRGNRVS